MRRASREAWRTWDWDVHAAGRVTFVAVFPRTNTGYLGIDGDGTPFGDFAGGLDLDGFRPISRDCWWRPDDPAHVWGPGTAAVASSRYEEDGCLYYAHFDPDDPDDPEYRYPGIQWFGGILDKPWRIRGAKGVREVRDPTEIGAATSLFDLIEKEHGFIPFMDGWLFDSHTYGGRWYFPVEWEADERSCDIGDVVDLMDGWRRRYGAKIHVYGMRMETSPRRTVKWSRSNAPDEVSHAESATDFLRSYNAWRCGDVDNWHPNMRSYW